MCYLKKYEYWLEQKHDKKMLEELRRLKDNQEEIKRRFDADLKFGTAGLRSIMGAGSNRMNVYTVRKATQGFADYINKSGEPKKGMVIAYDSRKNSDLFALNTALCFCANGIKTYLFKGMRSVPELSFAIRRLKAFGGVCITASHNPKEYNGYKVYAAYGGQLPPDKSAEVFEYISLLDDFDGIKLVSEEEALNSGLLIMIGEEVDREYIDSLKSVSLADDGMKQIGKSLNAVYTPLFGTGSINASKLFSKMGYDGIKIIKEQSYKNSDFPGMKMPNPEFEDTLQMGIKKAKETGADIVMGTDPDADRMSACIRDENGRFVMLSGNQIATLILVYLLRIKELNGKITGKSYIVKSIVSTNIVNQIACIYGIKCYEVLTGFRYISELITDMEDKDFIFGFEESNGFLTGTSVREKDGLLACLLLLEAACYFKQNKLTLYEALREIYKKYGWYKEEVITLSLDNAEYIANIMDRLNENELKSIGGLKVISLSDYSKGIRKELSGKQIKLSYPVSDVLYYTLEKDAWVCFRPSGTEPKMKIYFGVNEKSETEAKKRMNALKAEVKMLLGIQKKRSIKK